jgi:hypothetical protein
LLDVRISLPKGKNGKGHYKALPYSELPAFMAELRGRRRALMLPDGGNLYLQVVRDKTQPDRVYRSFVFRYELA